MRLLKLNVVGLFECFFRREHMWMLPLAGLVLLYLLPSAYGLWYFSSETSLKVFCIFVVGCSLYVLFYKLLLRSLGSHRCNIKASFPFSIKSEKFITFVSFLYFSSFFYATFTSESIALYEALIGSDPHIIAYAREALYKNRQGWERGLSYAYVILTSACVPYAIALSYLKRLRYRHLLLLAFVLTLIVSVEKSSVIKAFLPLIVLSFNRYLKRSLGYASLGLMCLLVVLMTQLSGMSVPRTSEAVGVYELEQSEVDENVAGRSREKIFNRFAIVDTSSPITYVMNRAFWIPYVTSYDWLLYFDKKLNGDFLHGRTNSTVALLTNQERFNMERAVFKFEFGGGGDTGTSNTVFLVDAFVNFGWLGVIVSCFLVALFTYFFNIIENPAAFASFYFYILLFLTGSLFSVMFGGGLILLFLLSISIRDDSPQSSIANARQIVPSATAV